MLLKIEERNKHTSQGTLTLVLFRVLIKARVLHCQALELDTKRSSLANGKASYAPAA